VACGRAACQARVVGSGSVGHGHFEGDGIETSSRSPRARQLILWGIIVAIVLLIAVAAAWNDEEPDRQSAEPAEDLFGGGSGDTCVDARTTCLRNCGENNPTCKVDCEKAFMNCKDTVRPAQ
jgi:hypothetical protein